MADRRYLEPNTVEWLDALAAGDPVQAVRTRRIIAVAGSCDVCSLCGARPASDYWVVARKTDPSPVPTLRLCVECVGVRTMIYEQKLVPVNVSAWPLI